MGVATNPRAGRVWRTLLAGQSAKGTPVDDLTNAIQLRAARVGVDIGSDQIVPEWWMSFHKGDFMNARYGVATMAQDAFTMLATPTALSLALESMFGSLSGSTFTLTGYVNSWLTMGVVEDKTLTNNDQRFIRFSDLMVHELELDVDSQGYVDLMCAYAAETAEHSTIENAFTDLDATLPAAPMESIDVNVFPGRTVAFYRDPAATPIPFERLTVNLSVHMEPYWDMCGQKERAIRRGPLVARVTMQARAGDEQWQTLLDADEEEKLTYRLVATVGAHTLTMTFHKMSFKVEPLTLKNQEYEAVRAVGMATQDLSENFVSISLT